METIDNFKRISPSKEYWELLANSQEENFKEIQKMNNEYYIIVETNWNSITKAAFDEFGFDSPNWWI